MPEKFCLPTISPPEIEKRDCDGSRKKSEERRRKGSMSMTTMTITTTIMITIMTIIHPLAKSPITF